MSQDPPPVAHALQRLRAWKEHLAGEDEAFAALDEELDALAADDPAAMLAAFGRFLEQDQPQEVVASLAAGPLEDFLGQHGEALIDAIETLARDNAGFRHALGGVWQNDMSDDLWERVLRAGPDQRW